MNFTIKTWSGRPTAKCLKLQLVSHHTCALFKKEAKGKKVRRFAINGTFVYRNLNHLNTNETVIIAVSRGFKMHVYRVAEWVTCGI